MFVWHILCMIAHWSRPKQPESIWPPYFSSHSHHITEWSVSFHLSPTFISCPGDHICIGSSWEGVCVCIPYVANVDWSLALSVMNTICTVISAATFCEKETRTFHPSRFILSWTLFFQEVIEIGFSNKHTLMTAYTERGLFFFCSAFILKFLTEINRGTHEEIKIPPC